MFLIILWYVMLFSFLLYMIFSYIEYLKEPETTYQDFTRQIFRIIMTKKCWPKRHFIIKMATRKNWGKKNKTHYIYQEARHFYVCKHLIYQISDWAIYWGLLLEAIYIYN